MASTAILQIKMVAALLESIDKGDAEQAVRMIRSLLASDEKAGPAKS